MSKGFVEYRVRQVSRFTVTRFYNGPVGDNGACGGGSSCLGEFENMHDAEYMARAAEMLDRAEGKFPECDVVSSQTFSVQRQMTKDAALLFRCPDNFSALFDALGLDDTADERSRLDDALKDVISRFK